MIKTQSTMAQKVAQAVTAFQQETTGHAPTAERDMAKSPAGAAKVQEFHRQLFINSSQSLRDEIQRITGVEVREAVAEVEPTTGAVVQAFTRSAMVQVFRLAQSVPGDNWTSPQEQQ